MRYLFCTIALGLGVAAAQDSSQEHSYVPPNGFVPDSVTAVRIAVAVWNPIYGEADIAAERPHRAVLRDSVWTVTGTLPPDMVGGVALAQIAKRDGRVLRVTHGQ